MKELSIEEKAKAYDEAIKRVENIMTGKCETTFMFTEGLFEHIFPELKESDDDRIRKDIVFYIAANHKDDGEKARWLYYLEKQGEQKPTEWSHIDENRINNICDFIQGHTNFADSAKEAAVVFLKSLKDRVQPQPQSDERNRLLGKLEEWLDEYVSNLADVDTATLICSFTNYLDGKLPKSLRPQNTWRPSDEQMRELSTVATGKGWFSKEILSKLLEDLKKLKG